MSDTTTEPRWDFRAYQESPENYARRMARELPPGVAAPPQPDPAKIAREQLALACERDGFSIDFASVREEDREPVVLFDDGGYRIAPSGERPTGHIVRWSCTGTESRGTDADDPVLAYTEDDEGARWFHIPGRLRATGGAARLRHEFGGEVTAHAYRADGSGIGYAFATDLDSNLLHVEFFAETAEFRVTPDK